MPTNEYELMLGRVHYLTERRQMVTSIYLSVNAALTGVMAFLIKDGQPPNGSSQVSFLALIVAGVVACGLWRRLIKQYSIIIDWWYQQLRLLEADDPKSKKLITKEYLELYQKGKKRAIIGLTHYETALTWLFTVIYLSFGIVVFVLLVIHFK